MVLWLGYIFVAKIFIKIKLENNYYKKSFNLDYFLKFKSIKK